jgi:hypothetical protein
VYRTGTTKHEVTDMASRKLSVLISGASVAATTRTAVGGLQLALISGMTVQYLNDPKGAPTADDLTLAMKTIGAAFAK